MAEKYDDTVPTTKDETSISYVKPVENVQVSLQIEPAVDSSSNKQVNDPLLGQIEKLLELKWGIPSGVVTVMTQGSEEG
ncbi:hypothetical protein D3C77_654920 [compost metagenome]